MKKIILAFVLLMFVWVWFWRYYFDSSSDTYTQEQDKVIWEIDWNPIREWTHDLAWEVEWVAYEENLSDSETAQSSAITYIEKIINYFLWIISLIALIYLLYHWFLMVTAAWDDEKYKKWWAWIKYATIALVWIWVSWFFVSLIFYLIGIATNLN